MADGRMEFHARTIMQHANFAFSLSNDVQMEEVFDRRHYDREPLNLILLHGLTGTDTDWLYGGLSHEMSIQYNLNIFMPTTGNSFYLNKGYRGGNYADYIAIELPEYIQSTFGIDMSRSRTMIGGLSMGGYGSIHTALAYPDRFRACIALSSALHLDEMAEGYEDNGLIPPAMMQDIFGDPDKLLDSDKNPVYQYGLLKKSGADIPRIYLACGTEDSLISANRRFRDFLEAEKADFIYEEGPGRHNWRFWNEYLNRGLAAILAE